MWSLKDDEYQTYEDLPVDEHGVQQTEAPEEEEGGDEHQVEEPTAVGSQGFETETVCWHPKWSVSPTSLITRILTNLSMKMSSDWKWNLAWRRNQGGIGWRGRRRWRVGSYEIQIWEKRWRCCAVGRCEQAKKHPWNSRYKLAKDDLS